VEKRTRRERSAGEKERHITWRHVTRLMVAQWGILLVQRLRNGFFGATEFHVTSSRRRRRCRRRRRRRRVFIVVSVHLLNSPLASTLRFDFRRP